MLKSLTPLIPLIFGTSLTKLGSTLALLGGAALTGSLFETGINAAFVAAGKAAPIGNVPAWIGFSLLAIGVPVAILGAYWQRPQPPVSLKPNPHDVELLQRFRSEFTEVRIANLRELNFGSSFASRALDPVFEVAAWRGAAAEFVDEEVEAVFRVVRTATDKLAGLAEIKTGPHHVAPHRHTALPAEHDEWNPDPQITRSIRELNVALGAMLDAIDAFERVARVRVPIAKTGQAA